MRLLSTDYGIDIVFNENIVYVLIFEDSILFSDVIKSFIEQIKGDDKGFILSDSDKVINFKNEVCFVIDPYSISVNDKMIITKLYQEINNDILQSFYENATSINRNMVYILDKMDEILPYHIDYKLEANVIDLLKVYNVKIDDSPNSILEKLIDFIRIHHKICGTKIFVLVSIKNYLTKQELEHLYEICFYEKVYLILLERFQLEILKSEETYIIDKDVCSIYISENNSTSPMCGFGEDLIL